MRIAALIIGTACAASIAFGRHTFGFAGATAPLYFAIAAVYLALTIMLVLRLHKNARAQIRARGRALTIWLLISWGCALAFAVTAPDAQADQTLATITAPPGASAFALDMSIAFSNPAAIISFSAIIGANIVTYLKGRQAQKTG
ncbi:hypothetical protein KJY77_03230 [Canibacter sp. lx-72]|uniref:hypothetical protein n=1 Tax=Canibacter zhuwentaonis TaxID=2837491 RepID=UPI001BDC1B1E|nr:hypothetical protein [Canibacter zhuwentaonis]MBT1018150.1 hypothetical protein [Canibacter zhuwentaonis]